MAHLSPVSYHLQPMTMGWEGTLPDTSLYVDIYIYIYIYFCLVLNLCIWGVP